MELSIRLSALADFVPQGSKVIDVGTDHAYIPIYLMTTQKATACLATDINKGPLEKAASNIAHYGITGIRLKQTDGLLGLEEEDADVVMISGMGGFLIVDILSKASLLIEHIEQLILQPQQDIEVVRKYLHQIGFRIQDETFVEDEEKYYTVISAVKGKEVYGSEQEYLYGKKLIEKKDPTFKKWVLYKLAKQTTIYQALLEKDSQSVNKRKQELEKEIEMLKEVSICLN